MRGSEAGLAVSGCGAARLGWWGMRHRGSARAEGPRGSQVRRGDGEGRAPPAGGSAVA